ncbi:MAG: hypothetical protein V4724_34925 [Pseudomonadota bacterium]
MHTITWVKPALALVAMLMATLAWAQLTPEQLKAMRERANLPAPTIDFHEFHGVYEADVPERVGIPSPTMKMVLECSGTSCTLTVDGKREMYPNPGTPRLGLFERTKRSVAKRFAGAQMHGCINLAGDAMPDGPFACKLENMLEGKSVLLLVPPGPPGEEIPLYPRKR